MKRIQQNLGHKVLGICLTDMKALGLSVRDRLAQKINKPELTNTKWYRQIGPKPIIYDVGLTDLLCR